LSLDFPFPVKCESPAGWPGFFSHYFYYMESIQTKMPLWADLFLSGKLSFLLEFPGSMRAFERVWGLTCDFAGVSED
jgi:hypothetical protein